MPLPTNWGVFFVGALLMRVDYLGSTLGPPDLLEIPIYLLKTTG